LSSVSWVTGQYYQLFYVPTGLTIGHWSTVGVGFTNNSNIFSHVQPFSIISLSVEPLFVGVNDLRDWLDVPATDHTKDELYKRLLLTAVSCIEQYLRRRISVHSVSEVFHLPSRSLVQLKDYPVNYISGITVSETFGGAIPSSPNGGAITADSVIDDFYFDLKNDSGIITFLDSTGEECMYSGIHIEIDYSAGYLTVPEALRSAVLMLASGIFNLSQSEGLEIVRFSDLQFTFSKGLFTSQIKDMLQGFGKVTVL